MIITKDKIKHAKNQLDKGNIIIYETDTLYGLGADAVSYTHLTLPTILLV